MDSLGGDSAPLLDVRNLVVHFVTEAGPVRVVKDVSFQVQEGETLGLVGESGCGKSVTALSIMRLIQTPPGKIESGDTSRIAMWMLDTDYDGRSLYPSQVFFPMAGAKDGWSRLAKILKAEIDEELIEAYRGTISLPFAPGDHKRVAVKIIDDRGIESLKIVEISR